jgi:signal transduction histidine kinase
MPVRFDQKGYHLIVSNLLSNALKYTPKGSVEVVLRVTSHEAIMKVRDTGMGIPSGDLPRIFQEFYRASNARRQRITGTGVGLSGVKDLVERFGGNMRIESREEAGTTVTVSLPLVSDRAP